MLAFIKQLNNKKEKIVNCVQTRMPETSGCLFIPMEVELHKEFVVKL
jgi:hypothetical protein